jgi:hypothetical protein
VGDCSTLGEQLHELKILVCVVKSGRVLIFSTDFEIVSKTRTRFHLDETSSKCQSNVKFIKASSSSLTLLQVSLSRGIYSGYHNIDWLSHRIGAPTVAVKAGSSAHIQILV